MKLAETHGPVTAFYMGPRQVFVSVCGFGAVQEALRNADLEGRPDNAALKARTFHERLGILSLIYQHVNKLHDSVFFKNIIGQVSCSSTENYGRSSAASRCDICGI